MKIKEKFKILAAVLILLSAASCATTANLAMIPEGAKQVGLTIDFNNRQAGNLYTLDMMKSDWNARPKNGDAEIDFKGIIHNRASVVSNPAFNGKALRILLPKDKILPVETGAQIFGLIPESDEVFFGASIYLPPDFECGREIKIPPGIYGGWKFASGGGGPNGINIGPSIRAVIQGCQVKSYVYHLNQTGSNDDGSGYGNPIYGDKFAWRQADGKPVFVSKGVKHEIMFYARMNTPGKKDGIHKVWYDGMLVLHLTNLEFRKVLTLKFDTVGAEIFRGGGDLSYATASDNTIDVGNFMVYVK